MAEYSGSIDLVSGIRPKNNGKFPLVNAKDVQVDDDGKRLDTILTELAGLITVYTEEEYQAAKEAGKIDKDRLYIIYDPSKE